MKTIQYPIEVKKISFGEWCKDVYHEKLLFGGKCGDFVAVRPCGEEFSDKTFLGILIGEVALMQSVSWKEKDGELEVDRSMYNPMIFIPELSKVVWGCGSWWGKIKDENQLRQITDNDINNVWYVKVLKTMADQETPATKGDAQP